MQSSKPSTSSISCYERLEEFCQIEGYSLLINPMPGRWTQAKTQGASSLLVGQNAYYQLIAGGAVG